MVEKKDVSIEMWREGSFHVNGCPDISNRCGTVNGSMRFRYEVRVLCSAADLDASGFICDSRIINLYWQFKYGSHRTKLLPSCENVACQGLADIVSILSRLGVRCYGAEIRVYGGSHSGFTARWGEIPPSIGHVEPGKVTPEPITDDLSTMDAMLLDLLADVTGDRLDEEMLIPA